MEDEDIEMEEIKYEGFYKKLRKRIMDFLESEKGKKYKYSKYLLLVPDFFYLLCKLTLDKEVPAKSKALLASAIAYYISPVDFLPEALVGVLGFVDDLALAAFVLNKIINQSSYHVVKKHWLGESDLLYSIQEILKIADEMIGSGLWKKIKKKIDG
ncbi:MAG: DUF1232 domain-containing protein [Firmicutes bacterium]|nr:DUF1232 domain-containing protein [Bacillota bacterium]